jgi:hypothetical protein
MKQPSKQNAVPQQQLLYDDDDDEDLRILANYDNFGVDP